MHLTAVLLSDQGNRHSCQSSEGAQLVLGHHATVATFSFTIPTLSVTMAVCYESSSTREPSSWPTVEWGHMPCDHHLDTSKVWKISTGALCEVVDNYRYQRPTYVPMAGPASAVSPGLVHLSLYSTDNIGRTCASPAQKSTRPYLIAYFYFIFVCLHLKHFGWHLCAGKELVKLSCLT